MENMEKSRSPRRASGCFLNLLTLLLVIGMLAAMSLSAYIYYFPYSSVNPFPPPTAVAAMVLPTLAPSQTPLPTALRLPSTWTPTPTTAVTPLPTSTPDPRLTVTPLAVQGPAISPTPTRQPAGSPFALRNDPVAISAKIYHPEGACQLWLGGQVFDLSGSPYVGVTIQLGGTLEYQPVYQLSLSGTALQYGPAGYEFKLAEKAVTSKRTLYVQLLDQNGMPLSSRIFFDTLSDCNNNLILINFKQVK
jgi:hypothetical protein